MTSEGHIVANCHGCVLGIQWQAWELTRYWAWEALWGSQHTLYLCGDCSTCRSSIRCVLWHLGSRLNRIDKIFIPLRYTLFSRCPTVKKFGLKHAWSRAILGRMTDREVLSDAHKWGQKCTEETSVSLWGLVYDSSELLWVTTSRPRVASVLQMVSELTLTVSQACTGQLRKMQ
jgi:hypothetical protein